MAHLVLSAVVVVFVGLTVCNAKSVQVIENKVSKDDITAIVSTHNYLRGLILQGKVPGQPRGKNLKTMKWDPKLAQEAQKIANSAEFKHKKVSDSRFAVGQNLAWTASTASTKGAKWKDIVNMWFNEHKDFKYPSTSKGGQIGHYTQVVWADTYLVGCGYLMYKKDGGWYEKLYVCNYGPAGNYVGKAPYET